MRKDNSESRWRLMRHQAHHLLHSDAVEKKDQHIARVVIASVICLSMLSVILETEPDLEKRYWDYFYTFEVFTVIIFSVEYLL